MMMMMIIIPGDVVVVQVKGDDLVEWPQGWWGDEVKLVVSDGEELEVAWDHQK